MKYRHLKAALCFLVSVSLIVLIAYAVSTNNETKNSPELTEEVSDADLSGSYSENNSQSASDKGVGRYPLTDTSIPETTAVEESEITQTDIDISSTVQEDLVETTSEEVTTDSKMEVTIEDPVMKDLYEFTKEVATYYGLDPIILMKIMSVESNYNPYAVSPTGDHGICQINENWYYGYVTWNDPYDEIVNSTNCNLYDVKTNVILCARELRYWKDYCNSIGYYDNTYLETYNKGYKGIYYSDYRTKVLNAEIPA